ncbi:alpha-L-fucosidase [Mucilaginibacter rubeus]|uniref:alpha-L-fucosidase n=1 Tax=Mucilaginibacter rubeus TaxID=2027860 RepID=A0AAE6JF85_9SPHI|nr:MULTISPECIES: alpha-L-fucosidase [Mucilaginibacter]QEM04465.1 alpha-L-fucosidase [Mucilaginibacter rubeus]QEM17061.1 alpha-L-fucosidase [Mucilaginibacter gossypii]QTE46441.1 alpha-L-fucosidase [Mucilaginibacter rubeus]QTE53038.1 alpha-L-fucosidase [Mucilaginibacter rubeus]QTE58125.1 alpha-L-fucosidase [Mucilaginibacter rubeus]
MYKKYLFFLLVLCGIQTASAQNDLVKDDNASNYNLNKPERELWLKNTGLGLFIHFSMDSQLGVVISHSLVGASDDCVNRYFNELPKTFDPSKFDPHQIATLAKLAGMKYIVFTTKHHSGFCMWDTKTTDFSITHTPYKKDLLKEFVDATREAGLQVGFYFSPEDFNFLRDHHIPISRTDVKMDTQTRHEYDEYTRKQCEELMTNYGKIDVLFIDGDPKEVVKQTCWKLQPDLLITRGAIKTPEQIMPGAMINEPWLSCITMGTAWGYQPTNERYKSGSQLIGLLIEARAKGGSLLLNVGPKPDGSLPIEQEERLREMSAWYFVNRECIDSVRSWVISKEGDTWFTAKGGHILYAIVTNAADWKEGTRKTFLIRSAIATNQTQVSVLGQNSKVIEYKTDDVSCRYKQTDQGLEVSVVKAQRIYDDHRWPNPVVIKLENVAPVFKEAAIVETGASSKTKAGAVLKGKILNYKSISVKRARFDYRPYHGQVETLYAGKWTAGTWVNIKTDGTFEATIPLKADYEYKAVVEQANVEIEGENKLFKQ